MAGFLRTHTSEQQHELEVKVSELYQDLADFEAADREEMLMLLRDKHTRYLQVLALDPPPLLPPPLLWWRWRWRWRWMHLPTAATPHKHTCMVACRDNVWQQ